MVNKVPTDNFTLDFVEMGYHVCVLIFWTKKAPIFLPFTFYHCLVFCSVTLIKLLPMIGTYKMQGELQFTK